MVRLMGVAHLLGIFAMLVSWSCSLSEVAKPGFNAVIIISNVGVDGVEEKSQIEVSFKPPDSWRVHSDEFNFVAIGKRGWQKRYGQWQWMQVDPEPIRTFFEGLVESKGKNTRSLGDGPIIQSEPTQRLAWHDDGWAKALRGLSVESPDLQDASVRVEVAVGKRTNRLYEKKIIFEGSRFEGQWVFTFDYESEVLIEPPVN